jgi:hypothetical protein
VPPLIPALVPHGCSAEALDGGKIARKESGRRFMTTLIPYVGAWILLAVVVLALGLYRKLLTDNQGDNYVHMSEGEARLIPHQISVNQKIERIDRWGEILTMATLLAGVALACLYLYHALWR